MAENPTSEGFCTTEAEKMVGFKSLAAPLVTQQRNSAKKNIVFMKNNNLILKKTQDVQVDLNWSGSPVTKDTTLRSFLITVGFKDTSV